MIAKKIPNANKSGGKAGRVNGLSDYITAPELSNGVEKCIASGAKNFLTDTHEGHKAEMIALAQEAVRSKDPVDHWVMSWRHDEHPTPEQAKAAVETFIKHCGLEGHQYIWGLHDDTKNKHVHIEVNRVHPNTLRVTEINKGFDREASQQAIALIEHAQGWQKEAKARYDVDLSGQLVIDETTGRPAKNEHGEAKQLKPTSHAASMEVQTGEKSAQRIGIEQASPIIKQASSWKELHAHLAEHGMQYTRKGSGAMVIIGDVPVKASDVDRKAALSQLEKRFGPYQPAQEIKPNEYHHHIATRRNQATQQDFATLGKEPTNRMRDLSECHMVSLESGRQVKSVLSIDARPGERPLGGLRRDAGRSTDLTRQPIQPNQPGWKEYITLRDEQKAAKVHDTTGLQKRQETERTQLYSKLKAERAAALAGDWKGKGAKRNGLVSLIATKQATEKRELQERQKDERARLQEQYQPLPIYKEWKDQPQIVSPAKSEELYLNTKQTQTLSHTLKSLSHTVDRRGHVTYAAEGKDIFRDEGKSIAILNTRSDKGIGAALAVAQQKYGNLLTLTGSNEFREKAVAVAVANGMNIRFTDPKLEELRTRLQAEKYRAERTSVRDQVEKSLAAAVERVSQRAAVETAAATVATHAATADAVRPVAPALAGASQNRETDQLSDLQRIAFDMHPNKAFLPLLLDASYDRNVVGKIIQRTSTHILVSERFKVTPIRIEDFLKIKTDGKAQDKDALAVGNSLVASCRNGLLEAEVREKRAQFQIPKSQGLGFD